MYKTCVFALVLLGASPANAVMDWGNIAIPCSVDSCSPYNHGGNGSCVVKNRRFPCSTQPDGTVGNCTETRSDCFLASSGSDTGPEGETHHWSEVGF